MKFDENGKAIPENQHEVDVLNMLQMKIATNGVLYQTL